MSERQISVQPPEKRIKNFSEVVLGINKRQALEGAKILAERKTSAAAEEACPLGTDFFRAFAEIAKGDLNAAIEVIREQDCLPGITSRLMPDPYASVRALNKQGERISPREIVRFLDEAAKGKSFVKYRAPVKKVCVAVVGSGPSGLTAAIGLARLGYRVTVFESLHYLGGVLRYGYPEFRLPKRVVDDVVAYAQSLGVEFKTNVLIGQQQTLEELFEDGFKAVFLGLGASLSKPIDLPGVYSAGFFYGDDFLMRVNLMQAQEKNFLTSLQLGQNVVVIGGGNTAFDCARSCIRLGCNVTLVFPETLEDLSVRPYIAEHAREEGVVLETLTKTVEVLSDDLGCVEGLKCRRYDYADKHEDGHWKLMEVPKSDFVIPADSIICAIGHLPFSLPLNKISELKTRRDGTIWTKRNSTETSLKGVFVGGDVANGPGPVVNAMLSAKQAVGDIDRYLSS